MVRGDDVEVLRPETAMQVFLCFKEYSANPYMAKWSASELAEKLRLILPDIVAAKDHIPSQVLRIALEEISAPGPFAHVFDFLNEPALNGPRGFTSLHRFLISS